MAFRLVTRESNAMRRCRMHLHLKGITIRNKKLFSESFKENYDMSWTRKYHPF